MKFYSDIESSDYPHINHLYGRSDNSFCIEVSPIDNKHYRAISEVASLGPLTIARIDSNAAVVTRRPDRFPGGDAPDFSFIFVCGGDVIISHALGSTDLQEQDFVLLDNRHARTLFVYRRVTFLIVSVSGSTLEKFIPRPDEFVGQKVSSANPDSGFLFETLPALWDHLKQGVLDDFGPTISQTLLRHIARACSNTFGKQNGRHSRRLVQVRTLVEENLCNPDLSVEMLAGKLEMSTRNLRTLFAGGERLSHYILRRRLEECANELSNPLCRGLSITAIALRWGFNSPAHFSRVFRKHYGITPREYRRRQHAQLDQA